MSVTLTWLHLSDLHCCPGRTGWDADRLRRTLSKDLAELIERDELRPDFLFFTGDAAYGHLPDDGLSMSYDRDAVHALMRSGGENPRWGSVMARLEACRDFLERRGYDHLLVDRERLTYVHRVRLEGVEVAIAGLNSAWSCGGDDRGRLWMAGEYQVAEVERQEAFRRADVRIGLVHHPLSWLVEAEATDLEPLFDRVFDFHLHGHEHKAWVTPVTDGAVRMAAGAAYDRSDRPNGYNLGRLDFESGKGEVWLRYFEKDSGFWQKRELKGKTDAQASGTWAICVASRGDGWR